jgi:hypothetical protein
MVRRDRGEERNAGIGELVRRQEREMARVHWGGQVLPRDVVPMEEEVITIIIIIIIIIIISSSSIPLAPEFSFKF